MIRLTRDAGIATLLLDRPDKRNALIPDMFAALRPALDQVLWGTDRALVLAGAGPVFCGGFDLRLCLDQPGTMPALLRELSALVATLRAFPKPVVIAAHGAAIAGGCALLTAADLVVTDSRAKIGYPVTPLGVSPAVSASTLRLTIGDGPCRQRMLDPTLISGDEAFRIGLVHEVVPTAPDALPRATDLARMLAAKPSGSYAATKEWLCEIDTTLGPPDATAAALSASLSIADRSEQHSRLTAMFSRI